MTNLSKSKYTRFCQWPKMLWLDTYRPELAIQDPALQRRFQEGNEVGDLAMGLLGDKVLPALFPNDPNLDYHNLADVHNGGEATDTYLALRGMDKEERDRLRQSLWRIVGWIPSRWSRSGRDCGSFATFELFSCSRR